MDAVLCEIVSMYQLHYSLSSAVPLDWVSITKV